MQTPFVYIIKVVDNHTYHELFGLFKNVEIVMLENLVTAVLTSSIAFEEFQLVTTKLFYLLKL
jgi:hypothetical protein